MAWLESHKELWHHPKTMKLARILETSVPTAVGHLHGLWYWCMDYAPDGVISDFEAEDIAHAVMWEGKAQDFIDALVSSKFADAKDGMMTLHDWCEYTGGLLDKRAKDRARKRKTSNDGCSDTLKDISNGIPQEFHGTSTELPRNSAEIPALHNITQHNKTQQDIQDIKVKDVCAEFLPDSTPTAQSGPHDSKTPNGDAQAAILLPLNDGESHYVTDADVAEMAGLYPAVDVKAELRKMRGWLLANPRKRKTKRGARSFVNSWLAREQDRGAGKTAARASPYEPRGDPFLDGASEAIAYLNARDAEKAKEALDGL